MYAEETETYAPETETVRASDFDFVGLICA
jgi:hypothetical protein